MARRGGHEEVVRILLAAGARGVSELQSLRHHPAALLLHAARAPRRARMLETRLVTTSGM